MNTCYTNKQTLFTQMSFFKVYEMLNYDIQNKLFMFLLYY